MPAPRRPSRFTGNILLCAACCAVAAFSCPWITAGLFPDVTPYTEASPYRGSNHHLRAPGMRLDPNEVSPNVEDRRGERPRRSDDRGGDLSRLGPPETREDRGPWRQSTDGRDVDRRSEYGGQRQRRGARQVQDCTSPWWSLDPNPHCGSWRNEEEGR
jgi:hypothetical protein